MFRPLIGSICERKACPPIPGLHGRLVAYFNQAISLEMMEC